MPSFVNCKFILTMSTILFLSSCVGEKGPLFLKDNSVPSFIQTVPLEANYKSLSVHLVGKSCLQCHHNSQTKLPSFEGQDNFNDNAEDILFYAEEGCDIGSCMPPRDNQDIPATPIPTEKVLKQLRIYIENL